VLGLRAATVDFDLSERRAAFVITPPPSATLVARIRRKFDPTSDAGWTIDELANQQTLLQQSHDELKASEDRFRRLAENTHDMIAEWKAGGICVYVSPNVESILGYSPAHFRKHAFSLLHPDDLQATRELLGRRFESKGSGQLVFRLESKDHGYRWFENSSNATTTETGEARVVTVSRDITQRRDLETQLRQSQKIEALGRLAGGVAHDFNNLLTIIGGASEALLESTPREGEEREDIQMILDASDRAATLTRQLLTFGRRQPHERRPLDLGNVTRDMEQMLNRLIPDGVIFKLDIEDDLGLVLADVGQLDEDDVAELILRVVGDADGDDIVVLGADPVVVFGEFHLAHFRQLPDCQPR
jgi:PAS domain S-box-containing protein